MWKRIAHWIIYYRTILMVALLLITVFMAYKATQVQMSYDFSSTVPADDPEMIFLNKFKAQFGEDSNIIAIGLKDSSVYAPENFHKLLTFSETLKTLEGVNSVISLPLVKVLEKDTENKKFIFKDLFPKEKLTSFELDSLLGMYQQQPFYKGQIVNESNGATMIIVSVNKDFLFSERRAELTQAIQDVSNQFSEDTGIQLHYAGIPFIRSVIAKQVRKEMVTFLYLSAIITGLIMFLFFRSVRAVIFSLIMIGIVVVWTLGTLALLNYKITMLSGLIPPVIVTIGITNAIYLLNKYHVEFAFYQNKQDAIQSVMNKMGLATFLTNLTVAIGFLTLLSTDIMILREFGIVAGLNIMALFFVSLITIPVFFSWMPEPLPKHLKHLKFKILGRIVHIVDLLVHRHRVTIYSVVIALAVFSILGIVKLKSVSYIVDDVPEESVVKKDLHFFEQNFSGIMPLVIWVDTGRKRGLLQVKNLQAIERFENYLDSLPNISKPLSLLSLVKASKQAFYNGNPSRYSLPSNAERGYILRYLKGKTDTSGLLNSFADTTLQHMRISLQMADIGSNRLDSLVTNAIEPRMNSFFEGTKITATITGTVKLFIKGNKFLIANLQESLLWALVLITLSMAFLFANVRMITISLIPNLLALMITAGLMGYLGIDLKASTALIFSITFGISVDNSIRFLAKYRQEQMANNFFVARSVSESILETGKSIIYTSIVLFAGFIIFAFSSFGGTIALGILTSTTLAISMFTNLIVLPSLIMTFDRPKKDWNYHLIDDFDPNFYGEDNDEEIDLRKLRIQNFPMEEDTKKESRD